MTDIDRRVLDALPDDATPIELLLLAGCMVESRTDTVDAYRASKDTELAHLEGPASVEDDPAANLIADAIEMLSGRPTANDAEDHR